MPTKKATAKKTYPHVPKPDARPLHVLDLPNADRKALTLQAVERDMNLAEYVRWLLHEAAVNPPK